MHHGIRILTLIALIVTSPIAAAIPILYGVEFKVESGNVVTQAFDEAGNFSTTTRNAVGNEYFGAFAVDSDVLQSDGIGKTGTLYFLFIKMEDNAWAYNFPGNNSLTGIIGPNGAWCQEPRPLCRGAAAPGFDVMNGEVIDLRGGVYGAGDIPFVNFSIRPDEHHQFGAWGDPSSASSGNGLPGQSFSVLVGGRGAMRVFRVPEPDAIGLLLLGLVGLGLTARWKKNA